MLVLAVLLLRAEITARSKSLVVEPVGAAKDSEFAAPLVAIWVLD